MIDNQTYNTFKKGSTTYFYSSIFLPQKIKEDVFILYRFVREVDDIVDTLPQDKENFYRVKEQTVHALHGKKVENDTVTNFVSLAQKYSFDNEWIYAFLDSMESDLTQQKYVTITDTEKYMYGSAEVIGLFMAKIMKLPPESLHYSQLLGKAMQYANFIRDIAEDISLGRQYLPLQEMEKAGLTSLRYEETSLHPEQFTHFIHQQAKHYFAWQTEAEKGFQYLPVRVRIPIQTASGMYKWTIENIEKDPFIVYKQKVKPHKARIITQIAMNFLKRPAR